MSKRFKVGQDVFYIAPETHATPCDKCGCLSLSKRKTYVVRHGTITQKIQTALENEYQIDGITYIDCKERNYEEAALFKNQDRAEREAKRLNMEPK